MSVPRDSHTPRPGPTNRRSRRLGLRSLLVLVALVPLLGLATLVGVTATDHWSAREAAHDVARETERLDRLVEARIATAEEQSFSGAVALSSAFGFEVEDFADATGMDLVGAVAEARAAVDDISLPGERAALEEARAELETMRARLDRGELGFDEMTEGFDPINGLLDRLVDEQFAVLIDAATGSRLPAELMQRVTVLDYSLEAFAQIGPIGTHGIQVVVGSEFLPELLTTEAVRGLIETVTRFNAAIENATSFEQLPAAEAWQRFLSDEAVQRTQEGYDVAIGLGLGTVDEVDVDPDLLTDAVADAERRASLAYDALQTSSADLRAESQQLASDETTRMAWRLVAAVAVAVVALVVAVAIASGVARPMGRIATAAGRVRAGDLHAGHVEPGGPREVASTAEAFNDMAATLTEVERRTIALAEEPEDPSLNTPLPGRVGQALQSALDRLRVSMHLAEERRAELERVATHDGLTGLLNRTAALDALGRELAQSRRDGARTFALFIDLDGLKPINDNHGHDAGDDAITLTADALRSATRDADVVARLGGDEFLVAGRVDEGPAGVEALADRIVAEVGAQAVRVIDGEIPLRCSAGIATTNLGADAESVDALVQRADTALYEAKRAGGGRSSWGPTVPGGDRNGTN